ncbi:MAG: hypothetical protein NTV01_20195 [Bacteroidia bacterium]|nr:hypothetical protein [Bacteroidia bacterium]
MTNNIKQKNKHIKKRNQYQTMIILKIFVNILLFCLILLLSVLIASYFTGRDKRSYKTFLPSDTLNIGGEIFTIENLAQQYKPEMYLRPSTPTPKLEWIWYEATPNDSTIDLNYHFAWENEINPNKTIHYLYSIFRAAYYGYPLYDIEYFQINVNKSTGLVQRIRFETSNSDYYFPPVVEHIIIAIDKDENGNYYKTKISSTGEKISSGELIDVVFDNRRIKAGVQTWNHLSRLLDKNVISEYSLLQDMPLKFLSESDYKNYKFVRKSQGDPKTKENRITFNIAAVLVFIFVSIPTYFIRKRKK